MLILPGYQTAWEADLRRQALALGLEADARFLGWVPTGELEDLYAVASCFVFPSLYEGFGLPVLEAMARGVPVACSDRGSLREVAGDAACLFDPDRPAAIAGAIESLSGATVQKQHASRHLVAREPSSTAGPRLREERSRRIAGPSRSRMAIVTVSPLPQRPEYVAATISRDEVRDRSRECSSNQSAVDSRSPAPASTIANDRRGEIGGRHRRGRRRR